MFQKFWIWIRKLQLYQIRFRYVFLWPLSLTIPDFFFFRYPRRVAYGIRLIVYCYHLCFSFLIFSLLDHLFTTIFSTSFYGMIFPRGLPSLHFFMIRASLEIPAAIFVMQEFRNSIPIWRAAMASHAVLIPTASPPHR